MIDRTPNTPLEELSCLDLRDLYIIFGQVYSVLCYYKFRESTDTRDHIMETVNHLHQKRNEILAIAKQRTPKDDDDAEYRALLLAESEVGEHNGVAKMMGHLVEYLAFEEPPASSK